MPPENHAKNCLEELAKAASLKVGLNIHYQSAADVAVGWMGVNVHPLQEIETIHQRVARDAVRPFALASPARMEAEKSALDRFFAFKSSEPALLPVDGQPVDDRSPIARFAMARARLKAARSTLSFDSLALANDPTVLTKQRQRIQLLIEELEELQATFWQTIPETDHPTIGNVEVPLLEEAYQHLQDARADLDAAATNDDLGDVCDALDTDVCDLLEAAFNSPAKITMIYSIEPFYLFRLFVPFRAKSEVGVSLTERQTASSVLTGFMNDPVGNMAWVSAWLESKILELDDALHQLDPNQNDIFFHLKGGRAQAYLMGDPQTGTNDWDTGVIINPHLPAEYWHQVFNKVHNLLLTAFRKFKQELLILMHGKADEVAAEMGSIRDAYAATPAVMIDDEEYIRVLDESNQLADVVWTAEGASNLKAELIDVGIPRRNSVEALEHWEHTRPHVQRPLNGVPIPGPLYFVDEYMGMARESFAGASPAPRKTGKRVARFLEILKLNAMDDDIRDFRVGLDQDGLVPQSLATVDAPALPREIGRLVVLQLHRFIAAHELQLEPGKAAAFDAIFHNTATAVMALPIPAPIAAGVAAMGAVFPADGHALLQWIALTAHVSEVFETQARDRADFFGFGANPTAGQTARRRMLETFVKALYTATVFSEDDDDLRLQFQLAVSSSFAASLHADYGALAPAVRATLDPVARIDLTVYCRDPNAVPDDVCDALIAPAVEHFIANPLNPMLNAQRGANGTLDIFWPQEETMGHLHYQPLIVRITVNNEIWPQISFVRGFPVLSPRDLVQEYEVRSAHVAEYGTVQRFKTTYGVLGGLLTQFDY